MNKLLLIAAPLLGVLSQTALAQNNASSYTRIYGILDTGVESAKTSGGANTGRFSGLVSGSNAASRLGFETREDLGAGMYAGARLESGLDLTTGAIVGSRYFNRSAYLTLGGAAGELRLGREYTPAFYVLQQGDITGLNLYGNAGTFAQIGANGFTRLDNAINYTSPKRFNTTVRASYGFGQQNTEAPKDAGRALALAASYEKDGLLIGAFYAQRRDVYPLASTTTQKTAFSGVAVKWKTSDYSVGAGASRWDPAGPNTATSGVLNSWWLGGTVKLGASEFRLQGGQLSMKTSAATRSRANLLGASYLYSLSKRTVLYGTYGSMLNNSNGTFRLEASSRVVSLPVAAGVDTRALSLGVLHRF